MEVEYGSDAIRRTPPPKSYYEYDACSCSCEKERFYPYIGTILACPLYIIGIKLSMLPSVDDASEEEKAEMEAHYHRLYLWSVVSIITAIVLICINLLLLVTDKWTYVSARLCYFRIHVLMLAVMISLPVIFFILGASLD
jgi:hypothetical protein